MSSNVFIGKFLQGFANRVKFFRNVRFFCTQYSNCQSWPGERLPPYKFSGNAQALAKLSYFVFVYFFQGFDNSAGSAELAHQPCVIMMGFNNRSLCAS